MFNLQCPKAVVRKWVEINQKEKKNTNIAGKIPGGGPPIHLVITSTVPLKWVGFSAPSAPFTGAFLLQKAPTTGLVSVETRPDTAISCLEVKIANFKPRK